MSLRVLVDGRPVAVTLHRAGDAVVATVGDAEYRATVRRRGQTWCLEVGGRAYLATVVRDRDEVWVALAGEIHRCALASDERAVAAPGAARNPRVSAPMPGKVLDVVVRAGQQVAAGDPLVVLEAMKMETVATADAAGTVTRVHVAPGAMVEPGQTLVELEFA
jgi:biotin carboxyl carrier protein